MSEVSSEVKDAEVDPREQNHLPAIDGLAITAVIALVALIASGWVDSMLPWVK